MARLGHVPALDGVRGIAIEAVTAYHFFGLPGGFLGVDLFFVLSGFLITTLLLEDGGLGRFYKRRAARLLPALIAVLVVCSPLGWTKIAEGGLYLSNFFRAFGTGDSLAGPLGALWSLAAEEQFYVVWPLLLLAGLSRRRGLTSAVATLFFALVFYRIGLAISGASMRRLYFGPDTHADGLVLGCLAALVRPRIGAVAGRAGLAAVIVFFAIGVWATGWLAYGLPAFELAAALAVLAAADGRLPELSLKPLVWLGLISYSLYLWQQPVRWFTRLHTGAMGVAAAIIVATLSYRYIEKPFRQLRALPALPLPPASPGSDSPNLH
jgi:peptidoglycan/LPS O-acetylase OafA/YrhL